jgi:hypothetical protein
MADNLRDSALEYHRHPTPGKIAVTPTKAMATQRDLALAYSPGVAEVCLAIVDDPREAGNLTARANLVAVIGSMAGATVSARLASAITFSTGGHWPSSARRHQDISQRNFEE